jgi:macrolide transport system ATP-binding/permease protein
LRQPAGGAGDRLALAAGQSFRTVLTLLGIIIGVASVIALLAVGEGSRQKVMDRISAFGTNLMLIRPGAAGIRNTGDIITLVPEDAAAIKMLPNIEAALPERSSRMTVRYGDIDYQTSVQERVRFSICARLESRRGQFFHAKIQRLMPPGRAWRTVAERFSLTAGVPLAKYVLLRNVPFLVIGVMTEKGASPNGSDQDDVIFVPINTGWSSYSVRAI